MVITKCFVTVCKSLDKKNKNKMSKILHPKIHQESQSQTPSLISHLSFSHLFSFSFYLSIYNILKFNTSNNSFNVIIVVRVYARVQGFIPRSPLILIRNSQLIHMEINSL